MACKIVGFFFRYYLLIFGNSNKSIYVYLKLTKFIKKYKMKMNLLNSILIITILLFVQSLFYSCGNENNSDNNIEDSISEENFITSEENNHEKAVDSNIITSFFKGKNTLPFTVDSNYFVNINDDKNRTELKGEQVKLLTSNMVVYEKFDHIKWDLKSFFEIDSMKAAGTYEDYQNKIDVGMVLYSDAYGIEKVKLNDDTEALIWSNSYSTPDACPYGFGTYIFISVLYKGEITDCTVIGENMSGGDPPSSMSRYIYSMISENLNISYSYKEIYGYEDYNTGEPVIEETNDSFSGKIKDGKISFY